MKHPKPTLQDRKDALLNAARALRVDGLKKKAEGMDQRTLDEALLLALGKGGDSPFGSKPQFQWKPSPWQEKEIKRLKALYNKGEAEYGEEYRFWRECVNVDLFAMCEALLRLGADPRFDGQKSLIVAFKERREPRLMDLLIEHGAKPSECGLISALVEREVHAAGYSSMGRPRRVQLSRGSFKQWAYLAKKGADFWGEDGRKALATLAEHADWRAFQAFWTVGGKDPSVASEAIVRVAKGWSARRQKEPDESQIWEEKERFEFVRKMTDCPGAAAQPLWEDAVACCVAIGWPRALELLLSKSDQRAKQRAMWVAWRSDLPEALNMALRHGADLNERAPASQNDEKSLAMFRERKVRNLQGQWVATGEIPSMTLNEARASSDYSHLGKKCSELLSNLALRDELTKELAAARAVGSGSGNGSSSSPGCGDADGVGGTDGADGSIGEKSHSKDPVSDSPTQGSEPSDMAQSSGGAPPAAPASEQRAVAPRNRRRL